MTDRELYMRCVEARCTSGVTLPVDRLIKDANELYREATKYEHAEPKPKRGRPSNDDVKAAAA